MPSARAAAEAAVIVTSRSLAVCSSRALSRTRVLNADTLASALLVRSVSSRDRRCNDSTCRAMYTIAGNSAIIHVRRFESQIGTRGGEDDEEEEEEKAP